MLNNFICFDNIGNLLNKQARFMDVVFLFSFMLAWSIEYKSLQIQNIKCNLSF